MCPTLREGARREPWQREGGARVLNQERPLIWGMAVEGGRLDCGGLAGRGGVDHRRREKHAEVHQSFLVGKEQIQWGKACLHSQDVGWGAGDVRY